MIIILTMFWQQPVYAKGKLLATPGVAQIEGSGGGGILPWAQLAGYATEKQVAMSAFCSRANVSDFSLKVCGVQFNGYDRIELSHAKQSLAVDPLDTHIEQDITSVKLRLYGDIVYSAWPQISLGIQHKSLSDPAIAFALGAKEDSGDDVYIAASKLHLGAIVGRNVFWNFNLRRTQANQLGLLGFGSNTGGYKILAEASAALFINSHWAVGVERRKKPDLLKLGEDSWADFFVAWFPNKNLSVTAAYLDLGSIAGFSDQTGYYFSVMGNF